MPGTYAMPMRLLRQYLMPESAQSDGPALTPDELQKWVAALPQDKPLEAARALADVAERIRLREPSVRKRIRLYDLMHETAGQVMQVIEAKLGRASLPLSPLSEALLEQGNRLLREFGVGYTSIAIDVSGKWVGLGYARPLRNATLRGMQSHARRLMLCYRVYSEGSRTAWASMHQLYRIARDGGFVAETLDGRGVPIEQIYRRALLIAFADPARLAPGELDRVRFYLDRYAGLAELRDLTRFPGEAAPREGCFLIRHNEDGPGRSLQKWHNIEIRSGDLLLDCGPLLARMRSQIDALEHGVLPSKIGLPSVAHRPQYLAMMKNLQTQWSVPPWRRSQRQHFKPRVELAVGLDDLWSMLSGAALRRRRDDRAEADAAAHSVELSEWSVSNESPTGFALQYLNGESSALSAGTLVGVRSPDRSQVHICLVRRIVSGDARRTALGLQKYAPFAVPTLISWSGSAAATKPPARAIVMPRVPALDAGGAVIVEPNVLRSGKRVPFVLDGCRLTHVAGAPVERCKAYEIFTLSNPE